jgi:hypothetical protein
MYKSSFWQSGVPTWQDLVLTVFLNSLRPPALLDPRLTAANHATCSMVVRTEARIRAIASAPGLVLLKATDASRVRDAYPYPNMR